jgi:hypothetical protein
LWRETPRLRPEDRAAAAQRYERRSTRDPGRTRDGRGLGRTIRSMYDATGHTPRTPRLTPRETCVSTWTLEPGETPERAEPRDGSTVVGGPVNG